MTAADTEPATTGRSRSRTLWIVAPIALALVLFIVLLATRDHGGGDRFAGFDLEGELAPAVVATTLDGEVFDLDDQRGSFVVLNFFQTTCVPCIQEHPELVRFHDAYAPSGFATVVSIAFDDTEDNIREFFADNGGDWPIITEGAGDLAVAYGVPLVPESVLIAPTGEVITKLLGGVRMADLEAVIASWQAEQDATGGEGA